MSAISTGGFTGADALLALATLQQANWNEQMSHEMRVAKLQSEMASDLASIKTELESANQHPERFPALQQRLHAFIERYGDVPELQDVASAVQDLGTSVDGRVAQRDEAIAANHNGYGQAHATWVASGRKGPEPQLPPDPPVQGYTQAEIDDRLQLFTEKLDASSTNDQLRMIQIKQLNDNINNNSGMVSGLIESRNNATASIINNLA